MRNKIIQLIEDRLKELEEYEYDKYTGEVEHQLEVEEIYGRTQELENLLYNIEHIKDK